MLKTLGRIHQADEIVRAVTAAREAGFERINVDLMLLDNTENGDDRLASVVSYETLVYGIRQICDSGHVNLVETLAERIAALCFDDRRVRTVSIRVEKLDVFADTASVGVEIERSNPKS